MPEIYVSPTPRPTVYSYIIALYLRSVNSILKQKSRRSERRSGCSTSAAFGGTTLRYSGAVATKSSDSSSDTTLRRGEMISSMLSCVPKSNRSSSRSARVNRAEICASSLSRSSGVPAFSRTSWIFPLRNVTWAHTLGETRFKAKTDMYVPFYGCIF